MRLAEENTLLGTPFETFDLDESLLLCAGV
jgi:hypothetical protein